MKFTFTTHTRIVNGKKQSYLLMVYRGLLRYYSRVSIIVGQTKEKSHESRDELEHDFKRYYKHVKKTWRKPSFDSELIEVDERFTV